MYFSNQNRNPVKNKLHLAIIFILDNLPGIHKVLEKKENLNNTPWACFLIFIYLSVKWQRNNLSDPGYVVIVTFSTLKGKKEG